MHKFAAYLVKIVLNMWLWMTLASALLLGVYDVAKKLALKKNDIYYILLVATGLTTLFLCPFLSLGPGAYYLKLALKAVLVTTSWVAGMYALKLLPITTVSTLKASRPMFVVLFSILLFGERLNWIQWAGVAVVLIALYLLSRSSNKEGIKLTSSKGFWCMMLSIFAGVASALYDKYIMKDMEPMFVQSWGNLFITLLLAAIVIFKAAKDGENRARFTWDWTLVLIAVFITAADALYFFALKQPDAMLSIISLIRRSSVIVTFILGALLFKEKNVRSKALVMLVLCCGIVLLMYGSMQ